MNLVYRSDHRAASKPWLKRHL